MKTQLEVCDLLLVFSPVTEARLFPYLSLPMLTAYLRQQGVVTRQSDLNLSLSEQLFADKHLARQQRHYAAAGLDNLRHVNRYELAGYLRANQAELYSSVFQNTTGRKSSTAIRLVRQGVDMLLETSVLTRELNCLGEIDEWLAAPPPDDDSGYEELINLLNEEISQCRPAILALSIPFYSQLLPSFFIARHVKTRWPNVLVILGGQQIMLHHQQLRHLPSTIAYVDGLGIGKGEETLYTLYALRHEPARWQEIPDFLQPGISVDSEHHGRQVSAPIKSSLRLSDLPVPDFEGLSLHSYWSEEVQLGIITCLGCYWGRCLFCSYGNRSHLNQSYEQLSAHQIANYCSQLMTKYGISRINFIDENTNLTVALKAAQMLQLAGYPLRFSTRNRLEKKLLDAAFCVELGQAGCVLMSAGYETNSQRLLDKIDKGVDAEHYQPIIDNLQAAGIPLRLSVMGGLFDETPEEFAASLAFLIKNQAKIGIDILQMLVVEPDTLLARKPDAGQLTITSTTALRGNKLLNFGMGRMGYSFAYQTGQTYEERLSTFLSIMAHVSPALNDELPPDKRPAQAISTRPSGRLQLHSWVRYAQFNHPGDAYFLDLIWQRIYRVPPAMQTLFQLEANVVSVPEHTETSVLEQFYRYELGDFA